MPLTIPERKAELVRREIGLADIAAAQGVTRQHVWHVLTGKRRSPRIEQAIADAIELPVEEVFGAPPAAAVA
jgi:lambda repressor-like predicted transcriptional regulator